MMCIWRRHCFKQLHDTTPDIQTESKYLTDSWVAFDTYMHMIKRQPKSRLDTSIQSEYPA